MTEMDVKLVATDLDGTLLGADGVVSTRTRATLRAVAAAGIEVLAITGRSHRSAVPLLREIDAIRWIVCSNGASVYDQAVAGLVDHRPLPEPVMVEALDVIIERYPEVGFAWETPEGLFHSPQWVDVRRGVDGESFSPRHSTPVDDRVPRGADVLKVLVAHATQSGHEWFESLMPQVPFGLTAATSGATFVELTEADANKGAALARMCQRLGVDRSATVAFGDNGNDVPMLRWVGRSYAMANAHPTARAAASDVAPHHDADGVALVLEDLLDLRSPSGAGPLVS